VGLSDFYSKNRVRVREKREKYLRGPEPKQKETRGKWVKWHVPKGPTKDRDFTVVARRVVEQAIGEHLDGTPLEDPNAGKNPAAVALGKLGGKKGGKARAAKLSPAKRKQIAQKAAAKRWGII
jgi:hypothetical protein